MIVKMKKLDLLLYHREQEKFLEELRGLGVVHITSEIPMESAAVQNLGSEVQRAHRIATALKKTRKAKGAETTAISAASAADDADVSAILTRFEDCELKRDGIEQELTAIAKDKTTLTPWGDFDPQSVKRLAEVGVFINFYAAPQKKFDKIDRSNLNVEIISNVGDTVHFVTIFRDDAPELTGIEEVRLPEASIKALDAKSETLKSEQAAAIAEMEKMAAHIPAIEKYRDERFNSLKFEEARGAMTGEAEGKLLKFSGWLPQKDEAKVAAFLNDFPVYASFRDPAEGEDAPVKLKNGKFNSLFEPVVKMYALPGYREMDVVPFVAPFFTVFYGLCLADAGYGLIITVAAIIAMIKVSPKFRPIMALGAILGISTMTAGVLMNGFFGHELTAFERFAILASYRGEQGMVYPAMGLSLVAAFLQMFLGMGMQVYMQMRDRGFFAGLQPISSILIASGIIIMGAKVGPGATFGIDFTGFEVSGLMIGAALAAIGHYNIGLPFGIGEILMFGGTAMLLLFNNIDKKIFIRPLTGIWELYNYVMGLLSNVLSYMRLFALGLAGGLLGGAVNQIAFMLVGGMENPNYASIGVVGMVLVLLFGHALNFGLSGLGSFIHPLRLTFVEFYGAVGFNGGGKPYVPFAKVER